jgi:hypothetical protein
MPASLWWAGLASLGAGAIHATAVGLHGEHRQAAIAFALLAAFQLGWGALALLRAPRALVALGAVGNAAAVAGWVAAKTSGIGFVDGLEAAESPGFADTTAAVLAGVAVLGAVAYLVAPGRLRLPVLAGAVPAGIATGALAIGAMVAATGDTHAHGDDHVTTSAASSGDDHAHTSSGDDDDHASASGEHDHGEGGSAAHADDDHAAAPVGAVPYDGTLPVDLSGVPGVTPEQQAEAEALVTTNITTLPRFADPEVAMGLGYRPIGDSITGDEHLVNWSLLNDGRNLDANYPEALVYKVGAGGSRTLEAAMYVLEPPATLDSLPPVGGPLLQYHVHNDLCWSGADGAYTVFPAAPLPAPCPAGMQRRLLEPMLHVWIVGNECGPFAALEGIGGGQVRPGEEVLCDHAHGSVGAL